MVSGDSPVLLDSYLARRDQRWTSTRFCDGEQVHIAGIMEHIEEAGDAFRRQRLLAAATIRCPDALVEELETASCTALAARAERASG